MKFLIQRVTDASVEIDHQIVGAINKGFLVLVGITDSDTETIADKMIDKLIKLRIFEDTYGKTNLSLDDVQGQLLVVSQFTLYADCRKGNRPSFTNAGSPDQAKKLYEYILNKLTILDHNPQHGEFGADMKVQLVNDGPFTIILDSAELNINK